MQVGQNPELLLDSGNLFGQQRLERGLDSRAGAGDREVEEAADLGQLEAEPLGRGDEVQSLEVAYVEVPVTVGAPVRGEDTEALVVAQRARGHSCALGDLGDPHAPTIERSDLTFNLGSRSNVECMTYVIALPCVDVKDRACVDECPVDCIYEGQRMLYIHPDECIDCGACEPVCPVEAIYYEDDLPDQWSDYYRANVEFFDDIGAPGGAAMLDMIDKDHPIVAALPPQNGQDSGS